MPVPQEDAMEQQDADRPDTDWERLRRPVPKESLQVRPGARSRDGRQALVIAYIDADYVADRLDAVVGPGNWRTECQEITDAGVVAVRRSIAIRVGDEWIGKWDYGYPNSIVDGQVRDEEPLKSAASDALKRAARLWGIGRELSRALYMYGKLNERKRFVEPEKLRDEFWRQLQVLRRVSAGAQSDSGG
jgi:hypothetical protein